MSFTYRTRNSHVNHCFHTTLYIARTFNQSMTPIARRCIQPADNLSPLLDRARTGTLDLPNDATSDIPPLLEYCPHCAPIGVFCFLPSANHPLTKRRHPESAETIVTIVLPRSVMANPPTVPSPLRHNSCSSVFPAPSLFPVTLGYRLAGVSCPRYRSVMYLEVLVPLRS